MPLFRVRISLVAIFLFTLPAGAFALITGGTGNDPVRDPGWPAGAAAIFNDVHRIAHWEAPRLGGGQHHAECFGDTQALNAVLQKFAEVDVATKRLIVHDGVGQSFWLNPNREPEKQQAAQIDWRFMVWNPAIWERLAKMSPELNPIEPADREVGPASKIEVYTGGNIVWTEVVVPDGIEVIDNRLEAHGYRAVDGVVLEGNVTDQATNKPLDGRIELQEIKPKEKGGYDYTVVAKMETDEGGKWVHKNTPAAWLRVVVEADGYVARVVGYVRVDENPQWHSFDGELAQASELMGNVSDNDGKGLPDVNVRLGNVTGGTGGRYETPHDLSAVTDANGEFQFTNVPIGTATVRVYKPGYSRPGLGEDITVPAEGVALQMSAAAEVKVVVLFEGPDVPGEYIVNMEPEGGAVVGSWGGSSKIEEKNQVVFSNIPPGKYTLVGHPNPTTEEQKTEPLVIDLTGGQAETVTITAH